MTNALILYSGEGYFYPLMRLLEELRTSTIEERNFIVSDILGLDHHSQNRSLSELIISFIMIKPPIFRF
jgi:hypothetical protein